MNLRGITSALAGAAIACAVATTAAIPQPAETTALRETIAGTIWRIDARAGAFDLLTAVGQSVRVRRIRYAPDLEVKGAAGAGIASLVPGAVCRVECEVAAAGLTATGAELLRAPATRTP